jgi:hypothetical protein
MISRFKHLLGIILVLSIHSFSATAQDNCLKVDLQAVSISPAGISLQKGKTMEIEVVMRNNGPCIIPVGDATLQITITANQVELAKPLGFKDECNQWELLMENMVGKNYNLFFKNTKAPIPTGGAICSFRFSVKGKSDLPGISRITLASSLSATARTSDMDGNNQSAYAEIAVGVSTEKAPVSPTIQLDLAATPDNCYANLAWQGIANMEKYEVEKSSDNVHFKKIASLSVEDQKANGFEYSAEQGASRQYYRLKGIASSGKPIFSKTTSVETKCVVKKGFAP